jgi:hypothetical protein
MWYRRYGAFKERSQLEVLAELRTAATERAGRPLADLLETIASRIELLGAAEGEPRRERVDLSS